MNNFIIIYKTYFIQLFLKQAWIFYKIHNFLEDLQFLFHFKNYILSLFSLVLSWTRFFKNLPWDKIY